MLDGVDWPEMTLDQASAALRVIEAAILPADERSLGALLYEHWISARKPITAGNDQQAISRTYVRELRSFPGDIALAVLRRAMRTDEWFPPLAALCGRCTALTLRRRALLCSLQDRIRQLQRPPAVLPTPRPMPGSAKSKPQRAGAVSWSPGSGNVERLARHLNITPRQAWVRLIEASKDQLKQYEAVVLRMATEEAERATEKTEDPA